MNNTVIITLCLIVLCILTISLIGYMITTTSIIREQEKEIAQLKTALKRAEQKPERLSDIRRKYPQFGDF